MTEDAGKYIVRLANWQTEHQILQSVRKQVFVEEQHVPESFEWDGLDDRCTHVLAETEDGMAVGTARLLPDGHIGRMAVVNPWRGRGIGRRLLEALLSEAKKRGVEIAYLHAQTTAIPFYEKSGFVVYGDEFIEAGIPHRCMKRDL